jgi:hypothetical protein
MRQAVPRWVVALLVVAPLLGACSTTCAGSDGTVRVTDGHTDATQTFYQSSSPTEAFHVFPAGRTLEFVHGLSRTPDFVIPYVSFDAKPTSFSVAPGNEAVLVLDSDVIRVRNDTCSDFYVRVVAWLVDGRDAGVVSDAGSTDGG